MNLHTKEKETHRLREPTCGCQCTPLYLKWIISKDLLYSTRNSSQCYVAAWMGRETGGEWIYAYVWMSSFVVYLELSQHC